MNRKFLSLENSKDRILIEMVRALVAEFNPVRMFLFGSQANGSSNKNSDYDFVLVLKENTLSTHANMDRASKALIHIPKHADVFVYSQKEFETIAKDFSSIPEIALNTGKEINLGHI